MLDVTLLGTSGMMPLPNRFLTALYCRVNGRFLLIDCGEGTQVSMKMLGWGFKNLDVICITHFHADHIAGLPGLLLTIGNSGRDEGVTIIGPIGIAEVVKSLCVIAPELPFQLNFIELKEQNEKHIIKFEDYTIEAISLKHGIPCFGYSIHIERVGKFAVENAKKQKIPIKYWSTLQKGEDVKINGKVFSSESVLGKKRKGIKVSYATDTRPTKNLATFVKNSDLYVAEGIYGDDEKLDKAEEYNHMLFSEAVKIAKDANVSELWLTHFSPSLTNPEDYLENVQTVFENTKIGLERFVKVIKFENRN